MVIIIGQIFISHSRRDEEIVNYFGKLFGSTRVKGVFKEIEGFKSGEQSEEIQNDIQNSTAIFILLGENVQKLKHTRDWVVWESAIAKATDKEIWVFEPLAFLGKIDVIIPYANHYMAYIINEGYQVYIRNIIESYDDADVLSAAVAGGFIGGGLGTLTEALFSKDEELSGIGTLLGAAIGSGALGYWADPSRKCPPGILIKCPECKNRYRIHMKIPKWRCPICNVILTLDWNKIEKRNS